MCGFVGFINSAPSMADAGLCALASAMSARIAHRGPDDAEVWSDAAAGIALAFRRLAIVDLTPAGRQPMVSRCGRLVIVFNGEIYNFADLRHELEGAGCRFRGHSDTEVLLEALALWGAERTLPRLSGMFAFAAWDRQANELTLARDHLGKKPLYYGALNGAFLFGSQPKAFGPHPSWSPEVDRDVLSTFLRLGYVPSPLSIYRGLAQLRPGEWATVRDGRSVQVRRFWDLQKIAASARRRTIAIDDTTAVGRLDRLIGESVERRLVADVPLGAFLSGGIDSSTIVAIMQARRPGRVKTFSIGFTEVDHDESPYARAVARHLGTDHHDLIVTPKDLSDVIPLIPQFFDEPFADASQVPTYILSALTRRHVTVALSGDGGDELFGGYTRYQHARNILAALTFVPAALRPRFAALLRAVPASVWRAAGSFAPARFGRAPLASRVRRIAAMLSEEGPEYVYRSLVGQWPEPDDVVIGGHENVAPLWAGSARHDVPDFGRRMQLIDILTYLPDDILVKVDRASMAVSLEVRAPLLDREIVEFSWQLSDGMMVRDGKTKWILRQVLSRYVPDSLLDRPKMGFMFPISDWLRGPLRQWAGDLLSAERLAREGYFRPKAITELWDQHQGGRHDWGYRLWCVLMFQTWQDMWLRQ